MVCDISRGCSGSLYPLDTPPSQLYNQSMIIFISSCNCTGTCICTPGMWNVVIWNCRNLGQTTVYGIINHWWKVVIMTKRPLHLTFVQPHIILPSPRIEEPNPVALLQGMLWLWPSPGEGLHTCGYILMTWCTYCVQSPPCRAQA